MSLLLSLVTVKSLSSDESSYSTFTERVRGRGTFQIFIGAEVRHAGPLCSTERVHVHVSPLTSAAIEQQVTALVTSDM